MVGWRVTRRDPVAAVASSSSCRSCDPSLDRRQRVAPSGIAARQLAVFVLTCAQHDAVDAQRTSVKAPDGHLSEALLWANVHALVHDIEVADPELSFGVTTPAPQLAVAAQPT